MKITDKINMDKEGLIENGPITIVVLGDSVTHGAVTGDEINYETVYWNRLKKKINNVRNYVPVNVINAGIGGTTARESLGRMERDVFSHNPDLVIVCYGLNDVNGSLESYISSLKTIFEECNNRGIQAIFMTPNMLNTYVAEDTYEGVLDYAKKTAEMQNNGKMDNFMNAACQLANSMGVGVCDCYSQWKEMSKTQDTTMLLANRINHPTREMHELFADSLFRLIFKDSPEITKSVPSAMYKNQ
ncbi:MAG: GDSL-type esterase/lipase family protein [Acutalibacteraceae bacterium]|nr:GDSL-type esterase/lipase family protein [Acutalibacteraceae bacterium]